ncbi:hypothetical protein AGABI2DRAFT_115977 [Agaricus bisporus var. bisporus H97]|uniref:hypothetical protein n=1 Tax=Agaricus bisporus var. bisporus (strain H97 / ATCC MYA-4626 / FGSC 10389) TaxID=936046 RepID=UPI00029F5C53|nr:hypothetical protein AGABI2DRAFT_115977 [Agaricus bisporus var. bisporus H97]EKV48933.1 hypothetical protein AGABI2DRAFT_115977 [Agaricus bisporus var. bisporus H97]
MKSLLFLAVLLSTTTTTARSNAPQVKLHNTTLIGRDVTGLKQDFFGGIPYAEPPLGDLRLKPPVLKKHLDSVTFDASNFGLACLQPDVPTSSVSEDCLTINIFRPSNVRPETKLPVLFWTYGGGFQAGSSSMFNGSLIVNRSIERGTPLIYVNFNYRLGPLGFPQGQEAYDKKALNLAIQDEIVALEWVQRNIRAFGGDENKVTVFGESAGAIMSSILYLNSPLDRLARGAILESGSQASSINFPAIRRQSTWELFVEGVPSCTSTASSNDTFDCLRQANSSDIFTGLLSGIQSSPAAFPFEPAIDGPGGVYPDLPSRIFDNGTFARVPFIAGTSIDEGTFFMPITLNSEKQIHEYLIANFSPPLVSLPKLEQAADRILELYPDVPALGSPFNTGNETFGLSSSFKRASAIFGDIWFLSQRRFWQQTASNAGMKSWGYLFTQPQPQNPAYLGTTHSDEIDYVYGQPSDTSPSALKVSVTMMDYWISFATNMDPNDGKGIERPVWEQYMPRNERLIELNGNDTKMIDDTFRKEQMDYINSIPAVFLH